MSDISSELVQEILREKRLTRRWKNIRFVAWFLLIAWIIWLCFSSGSSSTNHHITERYVSLVRLDGMISPGSDLSAERIIPLLKDAFSDSSAKGVMLEINSGGGTPVQASIIHDAILLFKKKYHKKVIVVGEDMLASGAYYIAVAADKIYVNPNTITGSIGVIMKGFGFTDLIKKVGVERRVYTSGTDKDRLDPFLPQNPSDIEKIKQVIREVHDNFIQVVIDGRKGKLPADYQTLFTGDFWSGQTAMKLGLVDGLGNMMDVMDAEFKVSNFKEYSATPGFIKMLTGQVSTSFNAFLEDTHLHLNS